MTVFVDDVRHQYGRMWMCHMWSDKGPGELLAMADKVGVQRKWIQGHPTLSFGKHREASWVHFDISLGKKDDAIKAGAVLTDRYGPVEHVARLDVESGIPERAERGRLKLDQVARSRALRQPQDDLFAVGHSEG